jgi:hypothetical protein
VLLFVGISAFAVYDAAKFYGPLFLEQNFPRGILAASGEILDHALTEYEVGNQTWALPITDFQKGTGFCRRVVAGDNGSTLGLGDSVAFAQTVKAPKSGPPGGISCQQEKVDKFTLTLAPTSELKLFRMPNAPIALDLEAGSVELKAQPNAAVQVFLPNGALFLTTQTGFTATLNRSDDEVTLHLKQGQAEAEPALALNYREGIASVKVGNEAAGKLSLQGRSVPAGKFLRILPSGIYEIP